MLDNPQQVQEIMVQPVDGPLCPSLDCLTYTNTYGPSSASVGCGRTAPSAELAAALVAMLVLVLLLRT